MSVKGARDNPGIVLAVEAAGGFHALGRALGISGAAVVQWTRVPVTHVLEIERLYRVPRWELRPDIYPPPRRAMLPQRAIA
jgi:DNA-binding transcriptional regulator YdaS (Cro superfamily)